MKAASGLLLASMAGLGLSIHGQAASPADIASPSPEQIGKTAAGDTPIASSGTAVQGVLDATKKVVSPEPSPAPATCTKNGEPC